MNLKKTLAVAAVAVAGLAMSASATLDPFSYTVVTDDDILPGDSIVWEPSTFDTINGIPVEVPAYRFLRSQVFVDSGAVLVIKPGVWLFGSSGAENVPASALVVAAGGKIYAEGTAEEPIVMTAYGDDPQDPYDLGPGAKNMWGGLILMGNGVISNPDASGKHLMEGIPADDPRGYYGGNDNNDNSGVVKYVSIRHGGAVQISNEEVNALTMGGVGSATELDYIEAYANSDDGFEFFGGAVNLKHAVAAFCGDDHFDYDEGYVGKGQFWMSIHQEYEGDRGGEHDGNQSGDVLYSKPTIANVTYIGSGKNSSNSGQRGILFRDNAGGFYYNALITEFSGQPIKNDADGRPWGDDLTVENSIFYNNGAFDAGDQSYLLGTVATNRTVDPLIRGIGREVRDATLDPRLAINSPALSGAKDMTTVDPWFDAANYVGAFGTSDLWIKGWTALDEAGVITDLLTVSPVNSEVASSQQFSITSILKVPNVNPIGGKFTLNGADISSIVIPMVQVSPLTDGGLVVSIPGVTGSALGAGENTFGVELTLDNGQTVSGSTDITVLR
jgi:hypothetical protein